MSSPKITAPKPHSWMAAALRRRWVRLILLIGVLVFEFAFIWFVKHFGWLESVNIWTQLGVIFVAALPLLVAALFLVRKRFNLTSAFVAFTMFAVFMGFTMRPVYEARQARVPAKLLTESGALVRGAAEVPLSNWMSRMLGDYAEFPRGDQIRSVHVENEKQLETFLGVAERMPNVEGLLLGGQVGENYTRFEKVTRESGVSHLSLGSVDLPSTLKMDLDWIANCKHVRSLGMLNVTNAADKIIESDALGVESLSLWRPVAKGKFPWKEFVETETVRGLKVLSLEGYQISKPETRHLSGLSNLRHLSFGVVSNIGLEFLHQMPMLKYVQVTNMLITADELGEFEIPANLGEFHLTVSSNLISETELEDFKSKAPEGCVVNVNRRY